MKRVLAIVLVFLFLALTPYSVSAQSNQSAGHHYSIESVRVNYTISPQAPSHQPAVVVSARPYSSLKYGALFQPEAKGVGETAKSYVIGLSTPSDAAVQSHASAPAKPAEPGFSIRGTVYSDQNGNGKVDYNETGLANWTINLEGPSGNAISRATTDNYGGYGFYSLLPGEYIVAENSERGWNPTSPLAGSYRVNLTENVTSLNFGNRAIPAPVQNATVPSELNFSH